MFTKIIEKGKDVLGIQFINYPTEKHADFVAAVYEEETRIEKHYGFVLKILPFLCIGTVIAALLPLFPIPFIGDMNIIPLLIYELVFLTLGIFILIREMIIKTRIILAHFIAVKNVQQKFSDIECDYDSIAKSIGVILEIEHIIDIFERTEEDCEHYLSIPNKEIYAENSDIEMGIFYTLSGTRKSANITISNVSLEWRTKDTLPTYDIMDNKLIIPKDITI